MQSARFRASLIELLNKFATAAPNSNIEELILLWVDHFYMPGVPSEGYLPDARSEAVRRFRSCFSEPELAAMDDFHIYVIASRATNEPADTKELSRAAWAALAVFSESESEGGAGRH